MYMYSFPKIKNRPNKLELVMRFVVFYFVVLYFVVLYFVALYFVVLYTPLNLLAFYESLESRATDFVVFLKDVNFHFC